MSLVTANVAEPYLIVRGTDTDVSVTLEQYGAAVTVTSASAAVYDGSGALVATYADASTTEPTVTVLGGATTSKPLSERWRIVWTLDGRTVTVPAQLVAYGWTVAITDADIYRRAPALDPSGPAPISSRAEYEAERTEALHHIRDRLMTMGRRPWLIVEGYRLREPLVLLTLALIFEGLAQRDPRNLDIAAHYRDQFETAFSALSFQYDESEDGVSDSDERETANPAVWL